LLDDGGRAAARRPCRRLVATHAAKDLHFNRNMEALKKMQAGADKLATVVGVTLGPKVCPGMGFLEGLPMGRKACAAPS
jgi:hypothetical protein